MQVSIWTDGSCYPNPGHGGWAAVLISGEHRREISGHLDDSTNNVCEVTAVIEALKALKGGPHDVTIFTDSEYTRRAINGMRKPTTNFALLAEVKRLKNKHRVSVEWVRGHDGNVENERCDELAGIARLEISRASAV